MPVYLRGLLFLAENGRESVSSRNLAELLGVNAWQIRKDFSYFGDFGTRGVGYEIKTLTSQIKKILRLDIARKIAVVGIGNLGSAVLAYRGFRIYGFDIAAAFDNDARKIGKKIGRRELRDIEKEENRPGDYHPTSRRGSSNHR